MTLDELKKKGIGSTISCPKDMGIPGYRGTIQYIGEHVQETLTGKPYVWVHVKMSQHPHTTHVWPSCRLGH